MRVKIAKLNIYRSNQPILRQAGNYFSLFALGLSMSACVSFPEAVDTPSSEPMEPIPKPQWSVGMGQDAVDMVSGEPTGYEILAVSDTGELRLRSKRAVDIGECTWVSSSDWFSPAVSWENCGKGDWKSGTQVVTHDGDELWPLRAGAKAVYKRTPKSASTGETGKTETSKCAVTGPVTVALKSGEYSAMKVDCRTVRWDGAKETKTWYWSADHGQIKYQRAHSRDGVLSETEKVFPLASSE